MIILLGIIGSESWESKTWAATKKSAPSQPTAFEGKKGVAIAPIESVQIELPDHKIHNFGQDFQARLTTLLVQSGKYTVSDPIDAPVHEISTEMKLKEAGYSWTGSVTPAATIRITVDAMNFSTGLGGDHFFYGFDERLRTPFNDGTGKFSNEFPLKLFFPDEPSWFGSSFEKKGVAPFDSRSGLDLGDGFQFDFLFAFLNVNYAKYHTELHLKLEVDTPFEKASEYRSIEVKGDGFFFDVSAGYQGYSAAISVARRDAMNQAFRNAIEGSYGAVERAIADLPLLAKVDAVLRDGTILLGTGLDSGVKPGSYFQAVDDPGLVIEVTRTVLSGSIGKIVLGDLSRLRRDSVTQKVSVLPTSQEITAQLTEKSSLKMKNAVSSMGATLGATESIQLPRSDFKPSDLKNLIPLISRFEAFWKSLGELIFLPYRIWRYSKYDQSYHRDPDGSGPQPWDLSREPWASRVGIQKPQPGTGVPGTVGDSGVIVAVIDSGVDYNHPAIHDSLWFNSNPFQDPSGRKDRYGWDFISNDSRPFDDAYHGTQVASVILAVNPAVKIMPLKIFNPWGITHSAAMLGAFTYAVDHGAQLIVCAWAAPLQTDSITRGVAYAHEKGVPVVTAAGDDGMSLSFYAYYPAALTQKFSNVISVAAVNAQDQLMKTTSRSSNFDAQSVTLAAPGENIPVAEPRNGESRDSSTGLAAAMVAGGMSRYWEKGISMQEWLDRFLKDSDSVPGLVGQVQGGRRLRLRK